MTFHLMFVHIILVRLRLLSGHRLGKSCSSSLFILTICYFSYFPVCFGIWVLIAPVPGLCLLVILSILRERSDIDLWEAVDHFPS